MADKIPPMIAGAFSDADKFFPTPAPAFDDYCANLIERLSSALDARGLELARVQDELSELRLLKRMLGEPIGDIAKLEARALAAEARLAQANEALEIINKRIGHTKAFLDDEAPFTFEDQKHLDANTPERAYWHHGYMMALRDVKGLLDGTGIAAVVTPTPPAQSADKCEWRFDGRGSIFCSCGATGRADPQHWQILAISCDDDTKCRACGKIVKLIAPKAGDV